MNKKAFEEVNENEDPDVNTLIEDQRADQESGNYMRQRGGYNIPKAGQLRR